MDLEGIVCKRKDSPYKATEKPSPYWIKVKNARYSQLEGREELFERRLKSETRTTVGNQIPRSPRCCLAWSMPV